MLQDLSEDYKSEDNMIDMIEIIVFSLWVYIMLNFITEDIVKIVFLLKYYTLQCQRRLETDAYQPCIVCNNFQPPQ